VLVVCISYADISRLHAEVKYKQRGTFSGDWNVIQGNINDRAGTVLAKIHGKWDEEIYITTSQEQTELLLHGTNEPELQCLGPSLSRVPKNDSRHVWGQVCQCICDGNMHLADAAKTAVEEEQRALRKAGQQV